jgi:hypothetical protein
MAYKTAWTKGLTGEKRVEMERELQATALLRSRLSVILEEKIESRRTKRVSEEEYASPSWALKQADAIGYERALRETISLLTTSSLEDAK